MWSTYEIVKCSYIRPVNIHTVGRNMEICQNQTDAAFQASGQGQGERERERCCHDAWRHHSHFSLTLFYLTRYVSHLDKTWDNIFHFLSIHICLKKKTILHSCIRASLGWRSNRCVRTSAYTTLHRHTPAHSQHHCPRSIWLSMRSDTTKVGYRTEF